MGLGDWETGRLGDWETWREEHLWEHDRSLFNSRSSRKCATPLLTRISDERLKHGICFAGVQSAIVYPLGQFIKEFIAKEALISSS